MITSNRSEHVQSHTTEDVARALSLESERKGKTVSLLIHEILRDELKRRGYSDITGYIYRVVVDPDGPKCAVCGHERHGKIFCGHTEEHVGGERVECLCRGKRARR